MASLIKMDRHAGMTSGDGLDIGHWDVRISASIMQYRRRPRREVQHLSRDQASIKAAASQLTAPP
jgi:hypothetical protein